MSIINYNCDFYSKRRRELLINSLTGRLDHCIKKEEVHGCIILSKQKHEMIYMTKKSIK